MDELYHHGITGQRWGIRRYQNPDGSLTDAGRKRYGSLKEYLTERKNRKKEKRKKYIENVTPNEIKKNINKFSSEELDLINDKLSKQKRAIDLIDSVIYNDSSKKQSVKESPYSNFPEKIERSTKRANAILSNLNNSVSNTRKIYNAYALLQNSLYGKNMKLWKEDKNNNNNNNNNNSS